jgi:RimJ/RimL family protein N-acetyltransferase
MGGPILSTERLVLSPHDASRDFIGLYAVVGDPEVMEHIGEGALSYQEARDYVLRYQKHWDIRGLGGWTIRRRTSDEVLGNIFLRPTPDKGVVEVGYALLRRSWRNGYATESLGAVIEYARCRGFKTIVAVVRPANLASAKVLLRCGFDFDRARETQGQTRHYYTLEA